METTVKAAKRNKIIYWIATIWLSLGMVSSGVVQLIHLKEEVDLFNHLGYPEYFLTIIGVWKLLGVVAVLVPKFPVVKEWAYAGFFVTMAGALFSHLAVGDTTFEAFFGPILLVVLTVTSWYFRPASRKVIDLQK
ncbi:DoxX family protein [Emticicia fluvialis]|uniref:DoxX family protein n=1 Tax=Emticicia fluvialis TaxID=2974474 RepID=UPI002166B834|nr:DoxX family protein [Emticicia fluvialis]